MYGTWELWWLSGADFLSLRQIYTYVYMISCIVSYTCNAVFFSAHSSQCRWHETLILRMSTRIFLQLDLGWSKNHQLATSTRVIQKVIESYTLLLEHVCLFVLYEMTGHETLILRMSTRIFLQLDLGWSKNHQLATSTRVIQKVIES